MGIIEGSDGNFYGTTQLGGAGGGGCPLGCGTVFKATPAGGFTTLHEFTNGEGGNIYASLIQGSNGNLYGTASEGGNLDECNKTGCGTIFEITPDGTFTKLYTFCAQTGCADGSSPTAGLLQGDDGNFYGSTADGGITSGYSPGYGTFFKLTPSGGLTTLYAFPSNDGFASGLVEGSDSNFYGLAGNRGCCGSIFRISPSGAFATVYAFGGSENAFTVYAGQLIVGSDANLYGTTSQGGDESCQGPFAAGCGSIFEVNSSGVLNTLYEFNGGSDGGPPLGTLLQGSDGNFYGVDLNGENQGGAVFKATVSPTLPSPVNLVLSSQTVSPGESVTLTWKVLNGFSTTLRQCFATLQGNPSGAGVWTGQQSGSVVDGVYAGSTAITPTAAGIYTYALTCGGVESGFATLNVTGSKLVTATALTSNSPVTLGSIATLIATTSSQQSVGPLTGTVTFKADGLTLGSVDVSNGTASLNLQASNIPTGTYTVTAAYSGDTNYQSSIGTANVAVLGYATAATLNITPTTLTQGQEVTLSTTVARSSVRGTPTGTVTFYAGSVALVTAKLSGGHASVAVAASGAFAPGAYDITAKYSGDSTDQSSTSSSIPVTLKATTATSLTVLPNPVPANSAVTLTANVNETHGPSVPTGTVTFQVGTFTVGTATLTSGTGILNLSSVGISPGTYPVLAVYSGDVSNGASTSSTVSVTIK